MTPLIVPVLNNFEGFTRLVASIDEPIEPIVIKNYIYEYSVAKSWNLGMRRAAAKGYDYAVIANDDTTLDKGKMSMLVDRLNSKTIFSFPRKNGSAFAFFAVNIPLMQKLGGFDENFYPAYFEDNDAYYRSQLAGYSSEWVDSVEIFHKGSQTQFGVDGQIVSHDRFDQLRDLYVSKWGGIPGNETFTRPFGN